MVVCCWSSTRRIRACSALMSRKLVRVFDHLLPGVVLALEWNAFFPWIEGRWKRHRDPPVGNRRLEQSACGTRLSRARRDAEALHAGLQTGIHVAWLALRRIATQVSHQRAAVNPFRP